MRRLAFVLVLAACKPAPASTDAPVCAGWSGATWPEADRIFQNDPEWLGADGAYSGDLGNGRVLWSFGDTFLANGSRDRSTAKFIRNSIAIQHGYDPSVATIDFHFGGDADNPQSFMPEQGGRWFWPTAVVRLDTTALLFYSGITTDGTPGGFQGSGWSALVIANPNDDPSAWKTSIAKLPPLTFPVNLGTAALISGDYLYAWGLQAPGDRTVYLARFRLADANAADLSQLEWLTASATWTPQAAVAGTPARVFANDGNFPTEMSIAPNGASFMAVQSIGFGATDLAARTAPAVDATFGVACRLFHPPESDAPNAFVYAGKAHPELTGADLIATYVPSSFDSATTNASPNLYVPHFVRLTRTH